MKWEYCSCVSKIHSRMIDVFNIMLLNITNRGNYTLGFGVDIKWKILDFNSHRFIDFFLVDFVVVIRLILRDELPINLQF